MNDKIWLIGTSPSNFFIHQKHLISCIRNGLLPNTFFIIQTLVVPNFLALQYMRHNIHCIITWLALTTLIKAFTYCENLGHPVLAE